MKKSDKMRKLMAEMSKQPVSKKKKAKAKSNTADVNNDGIVDEKDVTFVKKTIKAIQMSVRKKN